MEPAQAQDEEERKAPITPHTGYGYLKVAKDSPGDLAKNVYSVEKFIEKPNLKTAQEFMDGKQHFWNTSIIITKCSILLAEYAKYMPDMLDQIKKLDKIPNPVKIFTKFPNISISRGIFEKSEELAMLKSALVWVDVGDFGALLDIYPLDVNQNHSNSNLYAFNSKHNLINSIKPVVLIGVENHVVIEREDVILICNQNSTQEIKKYLPQIHHTLL